MRGDGGQAGRTALRFHGLPAIYANVTGAQPPDDVSVEFRGGKIGYQQDVSLGLPSPSSK
ncbi:hypothetical protein CFB46_19380 [Burkholderia sp. HI2761]|nr:hypothetical protein CFB46_19380 [Burkholderia sp. HI2761]